MNVFFIIIGMAAVLISIFGKGRQFYAGDPDAIAWFDRKISNRYGRILFIVVGIIFLTLGIASLLGVITLHAEGP